MDPRSTVPHHIPATLGDRFSLGVVRFLRFFADLFRQALRPPRHRPTA